MSKVFLPKLLPPTLRAIQLNVNSKSLQQLSLYQYILDNLFKIRKQISIQFIEMKMNANVDKLNKGNAMNQPNETEGIRVILSAPQLAAVLSGQSISPTDMLTNRLWGGLQIVGGVLEMAGAGVLCAVPEPTGLSKAGCMIFGAHGADTAATGLRQVWTGQDTATLINRGASKLAETLKAPPDMANNIGLSLDIAVPFGLAGMVKAMRASHIIMGRINLNMHEARPGSRIGGHTLQKHVGKSETYLRERLMLEPERRFVSTFTNQATAEWAISEVMRKNSNSIKNWAKNYKGPLVISDDVGKTVGKIISRKTGKITNGSKVRVILKGEKFNGMPYYILTSFVG